jgi:hypothetical protein
VIEGEGLMHIDGEDRVVRKNDYIFLPPGAVSRDNLLIPLRNSPLSNLSRQVSVHFYFDH